MFSIVHSSTLSFRCGQRVPYYRSLENCRFEAFENGHVRIISPSFCSLEALQMGQLPFEYCR